jgi:uncharacterized protein YbdZ (MbtH family)
MKVVCLASENLIIKSVALLDTNSSEFDIKEFQFNKLNKDQGHYSVDFNTLSKRFQKRISKYLMKTWLVDDDVNFFVLSSSNHKEQQQYSEWLDHMTIFAASTQDYLITPKPPKKKL